MNASAVAVRSPRRISYLDAIVQAQLEEMHRDDRVVLIGEDLVVYGDGAIGRTFSPHRVWNTPISENSFCGMAIGAAMTGLRPIVALNIASFMYLPSDQIINQAAKLHYMTGGQMRVPVVFRCSMYYGSSVAAQHSDRPYPMFMNAPGLKVLAPTTPTDMKGLLKAAIREDDPVLVFEDTTLWTTKEDVSQDPEHLVPIGRADVKHEGTDVTVIAIAGAMKPALSAARALKPEGVSVEVVDPRSLVPLDKETLIRSVAKTGRVVVVDIANRTCGAASEITAMLAEEAFESLKKPIRRVSTPDVHIPFNPTMEKSLFPDQQTIIAAIKGLT
jgi:pyruvate dehydrogenase E1 component beta subunit